MLQPPMISSPLKQTSEIDWIQPLKGYIRQTYGDDPERYAEECAQLNRLRQDMRGAGKDSASGRDLLYRYYGQLELLDLRFPVDENHIKISFTWFDAFTQKPTSQYSLAYEKASIIFNISAVLSCHAAAQNRSDEAGLKVSYHSFQASAGMFTYINDNFLHAPSTDLSRDTVKTLIIVMLAQAQEVFLEKQVADGKKPALLAKLASQAASHYAQAVEGVSENVSKAVFERVWLLMVQIKASYLASLAQYYQSLADVEAKSWGVAIARLQIAENLAKDANRVAYSFPSSPPASSNLTTDTGTILGDAVKRHLSIITEQLPKLLKDNDFIYHQSIAGEASVPAVAKLAAAKAIPVSELYAGQDIQRIIGPDIFQKIVPMAVTESASLYDEEKAKMVRSEAEKVEMADQEMAASLDYLKLPGSLDVLKGGMNEETKVDPDFQQWCEDLAGHESFSKAFEKLQSDKSHILSALESCAKNLDIEESVCEKMRSKHGGEWIQQPSSKLTGTLRNDIRSYRGAIDEASSSDAQLLATSRQYESDFDEMRSAGETDEADVLYQRAMIKAGGNRSGSQNGFGTPNGQGTLLDEDYGEGGMSVSEQISRVEDLLKKLNLIKKDRMQVLLDLKEKVRTDDISSVLILNKKSIANHESHLFASELEKYRSHQNRLLQANHKQKIVLNDLTRFYSELLQDKRVKAEKSKYDSYTRQRTTVLTRYRKVFQAFNDLVQGLLRAQTFYTDMTDTVESLRQNVETFVNNRRAEGGQLLSQIESTKASQAGGMPDRERDRLRDLMERMSVDPTQNSQSPPPPPINRSRSNASRPPPLTSRPPPLTSRSSGHSIQTQNQYRSPPTSPPYHKQSNTSYPYQSYPQSQPVSFHGPPPPSSTPSNRPQPYDPMQYPYQPHSPPPNQTQNPPSQPMHPAFSSPHPPLPGLGQQQQYQQNQQVYQGQPQLPQGYMPPPPPPGPPPGGQSQGPGFGYGAGGYQGPGRGGGRGEQRSVQGGNADPWAGLGAWQ